MKYGLSLMVVTHSCSHITGLSRCFRWHVYCARLLVRIELFLIDNMLYFIYNAFTFSCKYLQVVDVVNFNSSDNGVASDRVFTRSCNPPEESHFGVLDCLVCNHAVTRIMRRWYNEIVALNHFAENRRWQRCQDDGFSHAQTHTVITSQRCRAAGPKLQRWHDPATRSSGVRLLHAHMPYSIKCLFM